MAVDWNVNLAEVATLAAGGIGVIISQLVSSKILVYRMKSVEDKVEHHTGQLEKLTEIVSDQKAMNERLTSLRRDIEDLRRGKGFIREETN